MNFKRKARKKFTKMCHNCFTVYQGGLVSKYCGEKCKTEGQKAIRGKPAEASYRRMRANRLLKEHWEQEARNGNVHGVRLGILA